MAEEVKVDVAEVMELHAKGLKPKEIIEELGVDITPTKMGLIIKAEKARLETPLETSPNNPVPPTPDAPVEPTPDAPVARRTSVAAEVVPQAKGIQVMSAGDYEKYSLDNGRTRFGGVKGKTSKCTIEELRAYINSKWTPSRIIEKYQMSEMVFAQLVMKLSVTEMRPKNQRIKYNLDADVFF